MASCSREWQHLFRCDHPETAARQEVGGALSSRDRASHQRTLFAGPACSSSWSSATGLTRKRPARLPCSTSTFSTRLNLKPENQEPLPSYAQERYISLFRDDELAQEIMHDVTAELVKLAWIWTFPNSGSTRPTSNRTWRSSARIRLMATAARQFLVQLKRHDEQVTARSGKAFGNDTKRRHKPSLDGRKLDDDGGERTAAKRRRRILSVSRRSISTQRIAARLFARPIR